MLFGRSTVHWSLLHLSPVRSLLLLLFHHLTDYYAQPVQIALDCTVAAADRLLLLLLVCYLLRYTWRFVVFEWTDPVLCNTTKTYPLGGCSGEDWFLSHEKKLEAGFSIQRSLIEYRSISLPEEANLD